MRKATPVRKNLWLESWRGYVLVLLLGCLFFLPGFRRLPTTDRDEARFAQASKQMLERGNFVDIRFQAKPRYKKPIGIYWLQAASASLAGSAERNHIWPYRIPSFLGALLAVLLTFHLGKRFFDPQAGFLGALLLASSILLQVEARIATTDAVLLASIVAMQGALGVIYLGETGERTWGPAILFWAACGAGILVKGPVPVLVAFLTIVTLGVADRRWELVRRLHPYVGAGVLLLITLPWFWAIHRASGGQFVRKALLSDVIPKLLGGQESHGAPPGLYLALFPVLFWPGSLIAFFGLGKVWKRRGEPGVRFLLAWGIPSWLAFELIPTKLPHYILPVFPAVALLTGYALARGFDEVKNTREKGRYVKSLLKAVFYSVTFLLGAGIPALGIYFNHRLSPAGVIGALGAAAIGWLATRWNREKRIGTAVLMVVVGVSFVTLPTFVSVLPSARPLWISRNVAETVAHLSPPRGTILASVGFHEPSLVFRLGTKTRLVDPPEAVRALARHEVDLVLVTRKEWPALRREVEKRGMKLKVLATMRGFNYSKGKWLNLYLLAPVDGLHRDTTDRVFHEKRG